MFRRLARGRRKETPCSGVGWEVKGKRHHVQEVGGREKERGTMFRKDLCVRSDEQKVLLSIETSSV